jgi:hypothetical protein
VFSILEVLPVYLLYKVKPFIIWFYLLLLYYDGSLHDLVYFVLASKQGQDYQNRSQDAKNLVRFCVGCLIVEVVLGLGTINTGSGTVFGTGKTIEGCFRLPGSPRTPVVPGKKIGTTGMHVLGLQRLDFREPF